MMEKMRLRAVMSPGLLSEREDRGAMCIKDQPALDSHYRDSRDSTGYSGAPHGKRVVAPMVHTSIDMEWDEVS